MEVEQAFCRISDKALTALLRALIEEEKKNEQG